AQTQTSQAAPDKAGHHMHKFDPAARARMLEGRIAYIKTVLGITPAQEQSFNGVADAMRANAKDRVSAFEQWRANRDKPKNAVERLEMRAEIGKLRVAGTERVLTAFKPLYASLTPDQQKIADHMFAGHFHRGGMHGGHHRG
ncbi:MAG: Spy/CpxP family protein refolding chaperone, partial [Stellaceae bacterium]